MSNLMPGEHDWMKDRAAMPAPAVRYPAEKPMEAPKQTNGFLGGAGNALNKIGRALLLSPEQNQQYLQRQQSKEIGNALAGGDYKGAAQTAFKSGNIDAGLQLQGAYDQRQQDINTQIGSHREQQMGQKREQMQAVSGMLKQIATLPEAQRAQAILSDPMGFKRATGMDLTQFPSLTDGTPITDAELQQAIAQVDGALGVAPEGPDYGFTNVNGNLIRTDKASGGVQSMYQAPQERETMKDVNGVERYVDTGEPVFAGVTKEPERMTPYQMAQVALQKQRIGLDQQKLAADISGAARPLPPAFGGGPVEQQDGMILARYGAGPAGKVREAQAPLSRPQMDAQRYQKYRSSTMAKVDTKEMQRAREDAIEFSTRLAPQLDTLGSLIDQGVVMGPMSGARVNAGKYALWGGGIMPGIPSKDKVARSETFQSQTTLLTLDMAEKAKGSMSDSDRAWFQTTAPQLANTKDGARMIIGALRKGAERKQEYADFLEAWNGVYGGPSMENEDNRTAYEVWGEFARNNPIIPQTATPTSAPATDMSSASDDEILAIINSQ